MTGSSGFSIVVAMDRKRGIGYKGDLPWPKLKGDMRYFRELTTCPDRAAVEKRWGLKAVASADVQAWEDVNTRMKLGVHPLPAADNELRNMVLMGRKTWESLPMTFRPLPNRWNGILSRSAASGGGVSREISVGDATTWGNLETALLHAEMSGGKVFLIGGGEVYTTSIRENRCMRLYITEIDAEFPCDTFFPETPDFKPALSSPWIDEGGIRYRFTRYDRE